MTECRSTPCNADYTGDGRGLILGDTMRHDEAKRDTMTQQLDFCPLKQGPTEKVFVQQWGIGINNDKNQMDVWAVVTRMNSGSWHWRMIAEKFSGVESIEGVASSQILAGEAVVQFLKKWKEAHP